jgi:hypothetical protein
MRQIFLFVSLAVIGFGLYLKFFYDTPDEQITINFFVSWFLIIVGASSLLMNVAWSTSKKRRDKEE